MDQLSGGLLIFGVGVGWARQEFEALGLPYVQRGAVTNDYLAALQILWMHHVATYEGPYVAFRDVKISPKPVQHSHPPIWVGGSSNAALRRAVRFGNGWRPIGPRLAWLKQDALPRLQRFADAERETRASSMPTDLVPSDGNTPTRR